MAGALHTGGVFRAFPDRELYIGARNALAAGTIQDIVPGGTLLAGYMIALRGASVGAVGVDPIADVGAWWMRSQSIPNLVTEANFGFLTNRTQETRGSLQWVNTPAAAADPLRLQWVHLFDVANGKHNNAIPIPDGETVEIFLPAVNPAVVAAGATWEVTRLVADKAESLYAPQFLSRTLTMAEGAFTFTGKIGMLQFQAASVAAPDRLSIFGSDGKRYMFLPWDEAIGITGIRGNYAPGECTHVVKKFFSDNPLSIRKVAGIDTIRVEILGGSVSMAVSQCNILPLPDKAREITSMANSLADTVEYNALVTNGGANAVGANEALESALVPAQIQEHAMAVQPQIKPQQAPINPAPTFAKAQAPGVMARVINAMRRG